jgi:hypothetical protein
MEIIWDDRGHAGQLIGRVKEVREDASDRETIFGVWTFGGLAFGVRWLDSAWLACGFDAGPDCRREPKLPTNV